MNCKKCGTQVQEKQMVCHHCGEILHLPKCETPEAQKILKDSAELLSKVIKSDVKVAAIEDQAIKRYAQALAKVKAVLDTPLLHSLITDETYEQLENFQNRCTDGEFHIALVGAIKAGKSTLINALLDADLASTEVTPETASLTKFRASKSGNYVKVSFYTDYEWKKYWESAQKNRAKVFIQEYQSLNADAHKAKWLNHTPERVTCGSLNELRTVIKRWTSSQSPEHYFVKEVEVGLQNINLPPEVIYVDTPGLDDVVEYRSNITREYIDRADAVLVCVNAKTLRGEEMKTISRVFANARKMPEKIYIVATQIDSMNKPDEDWDKQQKEWLKYLEVDGYFGSLELATKNLIPVSAYLYSLLRKAGKMTENDEWELEGILHKYRIYYRDLPELFSEILARTNIEKFRSRLETEITRKYKEIHKKDITESYKRLRSDLTKLMQDQQEDQAAIITASEQGVDEIRKKKEAAQAELNEAEKARNELERQRDGMKTRVNAQMSELKDKILSLGVNVS